jgi:hypothetical protein
MPGQATLQAINPLSEPVEVTLQFTAQSYLEARPLDVALDNRPLGTYIFPPALQTIELRLVLEPGEHIIQLQSTTSTEPTAAGRTLALMVTQITVTP